MQLVAAASSTSSTSYSDARLRPPPMRTASRGSARSPHRNRLPLIFFDVATRKRFGLPQRASATASEMPSRRSRPPSSPRATTASYAGTRQESVLPRIPIVGIVALQPDRHRLPRLAGPQRRALRHRHRPRRRLAGPARRVQASPPRTTSPYVSSSTALSQCYTDRGKRCFENSSAAPQSL